MSPPWGLARGCRELNGANLEGQVPTSPASMMTISCGLQTCMWASPRD